MYVGYSSVSTDVIPTTAPVVLYYADGEWYQTDAVKERCPHSRLVSIATLPGTVADMYDCERGALTIEQTVEGVRKSLVEGRWKPIVYASLSDMPAVTEALKTAGIKRDEVRLIDADWTDHAHLTTGSDGTQWTERALGRNLNEYLLASDFFAEPPKPPAERVSAHLQFEPSTGRWYVEGVPADSFRIESK